MCSHAQCVLKLDILIEEVLEKPTEVKHQLFTPSINRGIVRKYCGPELFSCYGMKTVMTQFHIKRKKACVLPLCHIQAAYMAEVHLYVTVKAKNSYALSS